MNELMDKLSQKMLPFAEALSKNRYLGAIRDAFVTIMPIIIGCSLCTLLNCVFLGKGNYFDQWFGFQGNEIVSMLGSIGSAGMNIMTLLVVFLIARNLSRSYELDADTISVTAVVAFLTITVFGSDAKAGEYIRTYYLGAAGLFTGFIASILTVEIMRKLMSIKALVIKMPDSVPTGIARSFNGMIPVILTMFIFGLVRLLTNALGYPLNDLIFNFLQQPLAAIVTSPIGLVVIYIFYMLLWGFGIHSAYIIGQPILEPIYLANLTANVALISKHAAATNVLTKPFTDSFMFMGGAGNMIALVLAILIVSKRKDYRQIAKLGFVPSLFNISEPIMFGLPVVMNPILIIPMVLVTLVGLGIGYIATITGFMGYTYVMTPWTTPPLIGAFLSTGGSIGALITAAVVLVLSVLIYMPFVKAMDKAEEKLEEEA
ncbi:MULTISPECIES: PTS sugar transporter subunit IIC [Coprobacillaceae]|uniref:PTS sugar transporter subunit IIC n=1 Tax=Coprobacillaceae TaxID=2810280 RepID=UPI000E480908|nr:MULTISPECIES: PTS transporter subunit EIIC [Coprobacillaceae]RHM60338.1 PTS sugar transporter subunit IIC [Coprobacillus sp. AF33-1AC]RHS92881.1 PTS sugar transporter subunit IIC [Erysipelatoclostridium sp. AM42-17]